MSLARDGFALLPGFASADELARLAALVDARAGSDHDAACARPHNTLPPLGWSDPLVRSLVGSEKRVRAVADATGARDLRWISGYASLKEPHSPALWWHQDWWCWDHPVSYRPAAAQVAVVCAHDTTDEGSDSTWTTPRWETFRARRRSPSAPATPSRWTTGSCTAPTATPAAGAATP